MIRSQIIVAVLMNSAFLLFTGILFPLTVWGFAQVLFSHQANGSFYEYQGKVVGSTLIGQAFSDSKYFHPRPSAAGSGYDASSSGGTNLGPTSKKLFSGIEDDPATAGADESYLGVAKLAESYRKENSQAIDALVPVDAVTRSGSGLDPHISLLNASLQVPRVAEARGLSEAAVRAIVQQETELRFMGIFGEPRVNVFLMNIALDKLTQSKR